MNASQLSEALAAELEEGSDAAVTEMLRAALAPRLLLVRRLGAGGMGTVYLARDASLKRLVAVKVLSPDLARDPDARARFEREAESVAAIAHPNVVAVYSVGELANGAPYFVMQYVSGRSAAERLAADGPFDVDTARRIVGEVASALGAAHAQGIIHRDIKPANILIDDASGRAVVSDFGIAAVLVRDAAAIEAAHKLTQTGMSVGTPAYMSPEQLLAEPVTEKTDIYSMGLLGYELLTARGAYDIKSPAEIMAAHLRDTPIRLSSVVESIDPEFEALLASCLAKEPEARPSAADVATQLIRGAGVVLDWPPPGLEPIHGKLTKAIRQLGLGAVLLGIPFVLLMVFPRWFLYPRLPSPVFLASAIALGTGLYVAGAIRLLRSARYAARAVRAGHGWTTIIEVLLDSRRDTGALITGAREFAGLDAAERNALRRRRVTAALAFLFAAILPTVGSIAALPVVTRFAGPVSGSALLGLFALASVPALLIGVALTAIEARRLAATRRRLRREAPTDDAFTRLAKGWRETFEQVRRGQALGPGTGDRPGARVVAFVTGLVVIVAALLAYAMTSLPAEASADNPYNDDFLRQMAVRFGVSETMRPYRLPIDSTITPERAGEALHAISLYGKQPRDGERRPLREIPFAGLPIDDPPEFPATPTLIWPQVAMQRARRGFSPAERRALESVARSPLTQEFGVVARARSADYGAAAWDLTVRPISWRIPVAAEVRRAARASLAQAALDLADGKVASAEQHVKTVIGAGFAMMGGRSVIEALVGSVLIDMGRDALFTIYNTTGRSADAAEIMAGVAAGLRTTRLSGPVAVTADQRTDSMRAMLLAPATVGAIRWEIGSFRLPMAACSDLHQLVFGASRETRDALAAARKLMVRTPLDSIVFEERTNAFDRPERPDLGSLRERGLYAVVRTIDAVVGGHRFEACANGLWF